MLKLPTDKIINTKLKNNAKDSLAKFGFEVSENNNTKDKNILSTVVVSKIYPNSPASSKLLIGDIIVEVNKEKTRSLDEFNKVLSKIKKNQSILFLIQRPSGGKYSTLYRSLKSN